MIKKMELYTLLKWYSLRIVGGYIFVLWRCNQNTAALNSVTQSNSTSDTNCGSITWKYEVLFVLLKIREPCKTLRFYPTKLKCICALEISYYRIKVNCKNSVSLLDLNVCQQLVAYNRWALWKHTRI